MTTRERVIVGITSVAVAWTGIVYVHDWLSSEDTGSSIRESDVSGAQAFSTQVRSRLAAVQVTEAERAALAAAQGEWDGQPFAEGATPANVVTLEAPVQPTYVYSGYVQAGGRRFAIVNGREYGVNDVLVDKRSVVQAIEPDHVVLRVGSDGRQQIVPLVERLTPGEIK